MAKTLSGFTPFAPQDHPQFSLQIFRDLEELARGAADHFCGLARRMMTMQESFAVALAGGNTPRKLYRLLAQPPWKDRVEWSRVHIFWGDERCVPSDQPESNYSMAMSEWLSHVELPGENIHRMPGELPDREEAAKSYEESLRAFFRQQGREGPQFDLVLLGMGEDGHVASLFPGSAALAEHGRWVVPVSAPKPPRERLTLTLKVLNEAASITFLVSGREKAGMLQRVLEGRKEKNPLPAGLVCPRRGTLVWMIDRDAGAKLLGAGKLT